MNRRLSLLVAALLLAAGLRADEPLRPNILFVLVDDLGWGDFSCFGNTEAKTPNIDRLAAEGLTFSQFYVNSRRSARPLAAPCSPANTHNAGKLPLTSTTVRTTRAAAWPNG